MADVFSKAKRSEAVQTRSGEFGTRSGGGKAGGAQQFTTNLPEPPLQLTTIPGGIFTPRSAGEDKLVAKGGRNGATGFEQRFQVDFGGLLKAVRDFAAVTSMRVTTGQQGWTWQSTRHPRPDEAGLSKAERS